MILEGYVKVASVLNHIMFSQRPEWMVDLELQGFEDTLGQV